jgi:phage tail-like protein
VTTDGRDGTSRALIATATTRRFDSRIRMRMHRDGAGPDQVPPAASSRLYLRGNLPAIYQEGDFGLRFIAALETVWDPIIAILDSLPAYISPDLAPRDMLELMAAWLGVETDEGWSDERLRELLRHAAELARSRGTKRGLELQLATAFPDTPLRIEETGGVFVADDPSGLPPVEAPSFVVYCDVPLPEQEQAAVARAIEAMKPVHTKYRLRVKAPRRAEEAKKS